MKWNADRIVSICAIIVSVGTLFMIFYQTNLIRKEQKASVMPYIFISYSSTKDAESIIITNKGLGPAKIESVKIIDNGKTFDMDPANFIVNQLGDEYGSLSDVEVHLIFPGRLMGTDESIMVFSHGRKGEYGNYIIDNFRFPYGILYDKDVNYDEYAMIEIIYSSVYGDRWVIRSNETVPVILD